MDHSFQICPQDGEGRTAQTVIGPEFENQDPRLQAPKESRQTGAAPAGGLTADTRVPHRTDPSLAGERPPQEIDPGVPEGHAVAGTQAIA